MLAQGISNIAQDICVLSGGRGHKPLINLIGGDSLQLSKTCSIDTAL